MKSIVKDFHLDFFLLASHKVYENVTESIKNKLSDMVAHHIPLHKNV